MSGAGRILAAIALLPVLGGISTALAQEPAAEIPDPAELAYPLRGPLLPCSGRPCGGFQLVDLFLTGSTERAAGGLRLRLADRAFLTAEVDSDRAAVRLTTSHLEFDYRDSAARQRLAIGYRAARFRLTASAARGERGSRASWLLGLAAGVRLSPDVELFGSVFADGDAGAARPVPRTLNAGSVGLVWQHGAGLELRGEVTTARSITAAGFELSRRTALGQIVAQRGGAQFVGEVRYERGAGPHPAFDTDDLRGRLRFELRVKGHLRLEARGAYGRELGLDDNHRAYGLGATFYARRYRYSRAGYAAGPVRDLAVAALERGYDARREYTLFGSRALRDRLLISTDRVELAPLIEALYRATVADRNVPVFGLSFHAEHDAFRGLEIRDARALIGVPWPAAWPWQRHENAVRFLELHIRYREADISAGLVETGWTVLALAHLNRETRAWLTWRDPLATALQLATDTAPGYELQLGLQYAFGI